MNHFFNHPFIHRCSYSAQSERGGIEDRACCTVTATAVAFNILWTEAHKWLANLGRKNYRGFSMYRALGSKKVELLGEAREAKWFYKNEYRAGITVKSFLRSCDPGKRYIVVVSHHCFAVVDGKMHDDKEQLNRRVRSIFEVTPHLQRPGAINLPMLVKKNLTAAATCEKVLA